MSAPRFDVPLCAEPDAYDIAHLIMLEVAANACRDAGWDPLALPSRNAGVYIGHARTSPLSAEIAFSTYVEDCADGLNRVPAFERLPDSLRQAIIGDIVRKVRRNKPHRRKSGKPFTEPAMAATLVSQTLGLTGPHMVIDAAGAVFPGAGTASTFWEMLVSGRDPKTVVPAERWDPGIYWAPRATGPWRSPSRIGGFVSDFKLDPKKFRIPPKQMETADLLQYIVLDATVQALRDARYDDKSFDRRRVGVIVGTMFCSEFMRSLTVALQYPEFERELQNLLNEQALPADQVRSILADARKAFHQRKPMLKDETGSFSASTLASRVARTLDLMGGAFSVDAEEASSGAAPFGSLRHGVVCRRAAVHGYWDL